VRLGERQAAEVADQPSHRGRLAHQLARRHAIAGAHRVAQAELEGIHAEALGEQIHLRLVAEAHLDGAEAAHGAVGAVVCAGVAGPDLQVWDPVGSGREDGGVGGHRG
jgi:hypothetical protein